MNRVVDQQLFDRMGIDECEIEYRMHLMGITPADIEMVARCRPYIQQNIRDIVFAFFEGLSDIREAAYLFEDKVTLHRLHKMIERYVLDIFGGEYDRAYVEDRLYIGLVHKRKDIHPKFYISAMQSLRNILLKVLNPHFDENPTVFEAILSVGKFLYLDALFVLDAYFYTYVSEVDDARKELESYARSLEEKVAERTRELEELSRRDSLTKLYNHRAFNEYLRRDLALAIRQSTPLCLVYIDIDDFKKINDAYGHHEGDEVLKVLGTVLLEVSRESDVPCRYGGDEICVILPNSTEEQAMTYCRRVMDQLTYYYSDITLSIGLIQSGPTNHYDMDTLVQMADRMMYTAKRGGGHRIVTSDAGHSAEGAA